MSIPGPPGGQYAAGQPRDPRQGRHPQDPNQGGQPRQPHTRPAVDPWGQGGAPVQGADGTDPHQPVRYPLPPRYPASPQYQIPAQYQAPAQYQEPAQYPAPAQHPMPPRHPSPPQYQAPAQHPMPPRHPSPPQYQMPAQHPVPPRYQTPQHPVPPQHGSWPEPTGTLPAGEMPTQYLQRFGYGQQPAPVDGPPEQPRRRGRRLVPVLVVMAVLLGGAVAVGAYLTSTRHGDTGFRSAAAARPATSAARPETSAPASQPAPTATASAAAGSDNGAAANDATTAKIGDCLVNDGTDSAPEMRKVDCVKDSYEVLKRFPGTTDKSKCNGIPGYTHNYFFESSAGTDSFVLCLKQRK